MSQHRPHLSASSSSFYESNPSDRSYTMGGGGGGRVNQAPSTTPQRRTNPMPPSYLNTPTRMTPVDTSSTSGIFDDTQVDHRYDHDQIPVTPIRPSSHQQHQQYQYENGRTPVHTNGPINSSSTTTTPGASVPFERSNGSRPTTSTTTPSSHVPPSPTAPRRPTTATQQSSATPTTQSSMFSSMQYQDNFAQEGNAMSDQLKRSAYRAVGQQQQQQPQQQSQPQQPPQQPQYTQRDFQPTQYVDEVEQRHQQQQQQQQQHSYISPTTSPSITKEGGDYVSAIEKQLNFITKQLEKEKAKNRELQLSYSNQSSTTTAPTSMNGSGMNGDYYSHQQQQQPQQQQSQPQQQPPQYQQSQSQGQGQQKYFNISDDIMDNFDELNQIRKQLDDTVDKLYREKEKCSEKEAINTDLRKQIDMIEREKMELQKSTFSFKSHISLVEGRLKEREAETMSLRGVKEHKHILEREKKLLEENNSKYLDDINDMSIRFNTTIAEKSRTEESMKSEIAKLGEDNLKLARENLALREDYEQQIAHLQYFQKNENEMKSEIGSLQSDIKIVKTDHETLRRKNDELLRQLRQKSAVADQVDQLREQLHEKDQHIANLVKFEKEALPRLQTLEPQNRKLDQQVQQLTAEIDRLKDQKKQESASYQSKLALFETNMKAASAHAQQTISQKDSQLKDYKDKMDALRKQFGMTSISSGSGVGDGSSSSMSGSGIRTSPMSSSQHQPQPRVPQPQPHHHTQQPIQQQTHHHQQPTTFSQQQQHHTQQQQPIPTHRPMAGGQSGGIGGGSSMRH
ncbi:hypothetical protein DFA_01147 [Cavenderia fasciculata]|uniref:Uncharacterized protein n=1 Tax=Cavenderia fasciculata TaxID=261658 RepID=F4PR68_CACFS|nr:uncharacterized protein DFA_01147 [Cavenderia fasciculata]EGG21268.1 hypothetical protein DFA_01147 [Cavenderia fasciculata]|eukprot:XP_004359118.1 hypothetical protein DFA_01147 [Cavenderia fasciculata]